MNHRIPETASPRAACRLVGLIAVATTIASLLSGLNSLMQLVKAAIALGIRPH